MGRSSYMKHEFFFVRPKPKGDDIGRLAHVNVKLIL